MILITPSGFEIRDEGVTQDQAFVLDFVGSGVSAAVVNGLATITVSSGGLSEAEIYARITLGL